MQETKRRRILSRHPHNFYDKVFQVTVHFACHLTVSRSMDYEIVYARKVSSSGEKGRVLKKNPTKIELATPKDLRLATWKLF